MTSAARSFMAGRLSMYRAQRAPPEKTIAIANTPPIGVSSHRGHDDRKPLRANLAATTNLTTQARDRTTHNQNARTDWKKYVPGTENAQAAYPRARAAARADGQPGGFRQSVAANRLGGSCTA